MFQLLITVFFSLYAICTATETLTVDGISKLPPSVFKSNEYSEPYTGSQMRVKYTIETDGLGRDLAKGPDDPQYPKCHMTIGKTGPEQKSLFATDVKKTYCDFNFELGTEATDIGFLLALQDENDIDQVTTYIELAIPAFPDNLDDAAMWVGKGDDIALRVDDGSTLGFSYDGKDCTKGDSGDICYYVGVTKDKNNPIHLCQEVTPTVPPTKMNVQAQSDITVCDQTQKIADAVDVFGNGAVPDTAEISYAKTGKADVTVTRTNDEFELVVYTMADGNIDESSLAICLTLPCSVKHASATNTYTVMMVGTASGASEVKDSTVHMMDDYEVIGTPLSTTLIEARWKHQDDTFNKYHVTRDKLGEDDTSFITTTVTCENELAAENFHCFGYFTGLKPDTPHTLSVQITNEAGTTHNETNKITLTGTKTAAETFASSTGTHPV